MLILIPVFQACFVIRMLALTMVWFSTFEHRVAPSFMSTLDIIIAELSNKLPWSCLVL